MARQSEPSTAMPMAAADILTEKGMGREIETLGKAYLSSGMVTKGEAE